MELVNGATSSKICDFLTAKLYTRKRIFIQFIPLIWEGDSPHAQCICTLIVLKSHNVDVLDTVVPIANVRVLMLI